MVKRNSHCDRSAKGNSTNEISASTWLRPLHSNLLKPTNQSVEFGQPKFRLLNDAQSTDRIRPSNLPALWSLTRPTVTYTLMFSITMRALARCSVRSSCALRASNHPVAHSDPYRRKLVHQSRTAHTCTCVTTGVPRAWLLGERSRSGTCDVCQRSLVPRSPLPKVSSSLFHFQQTPSSWGCRAPSSKEYFANPCACGMFSYLWRVRTRFGRFLHIVSTLFLGDAAAL